MSFEATPVKFNIPEVEEKPIQFEPFKDSDNRELPKDEYSYKLMPFKEGPKVGKSRWLVSLIIKPYVYTRVKNLKGKQRWMCIHCNNEGFLTYAFSNETIGPDGKPYHQLISADSFHACNPCPSYHLIKMFKDQLNNVVLADPVIRVEVAYETLKNQMCESLEPALKTLFLQNMPSATCVANTLSKVRKAFGLMHEQTLICELCSFQASDSTSMRKHRTSKHKEVLENPFKCDICGKGFLKMEKYAVHCKNVHNVFQDSFANLKLFSCDRCDYIATEPREIKIHIDTIHEKLTPFQCDICQKAFGRKEKMVRHRKSVHKTNMDSINPIYI